MYHRDTKETLEPLCELARVASWRTQNIYTYTKVYLLQGSKKSSGEKIKYGNMWQPHLQDNYK